MPGAVLPYKDTKPQGAADFYFVINATFRFILERLGRPAWIAYLENLAHGYFRPVNDLWRAGGLPGIARYWKAFFAAEPGADVTVSLKPESVAIEIRRCPAIAHLKAGGRAIVPQYCEHCYHLGEARAAAAGFSMRLSGGDGACLHTYQKAGELPPQDMAEIRKATSC